HVMRVRQNTVLTLLNDSGSVSSMINGDDPEAVILYVRVKYVVETSVVMTYYQLLFMVMLHLQVRA
ncbi:hypothetical protein, partial [Streptococcus agalactiae]|uniref:hypothetical protein n=1 Tax=Streptococcus agalactiae TaxID=1311 RepID=UPI001C609028